MRSTITVSIPKNLKDDLDKVSAEEGLSRSEVIRDSLRDHLFFKRFRTLRRRMVAKASAQGVITDEDVFERMS